MSLASRGMLRPPLHHPYCSWRVIPIPLEYKSTAASSYRLAVIYETYPSWHISNRSYKSLCFTAHGSSASSTTLVLTSPTVHRLVISMELPPRITQVEQCNLLARRLLRLGNMIPTVTGGGMDSDGGSGGIGSGGDTQYDGGKVCDMEQVGSCTEQGPPMQRVVDREIVGVMVIGGSHGQKSRDLCSVDGIWEAWGSDVNP
ncbi:hypothetical protein Tco_0722587 [Tanacetum coccineum]